MASKGLEKWRKGVTKNVKGDKANAFGLAEKVGRVAGARAANAEGVTAPVNKMLTGMDKLGGSDRDKYAK